MKATATSKPTSTHRIDQADPSVIQGGYRVGSLTKAGRLNWAFDQLLTFDEAQEIAAASRLAAIPPGSCPPATRLVPLSPRAAKRLEKLRAVPKPTRTKLVPAVVEINSEQAMFEARLNNGMWMLEELAESFGVDLEFSAVNDPPNSTLSLAVWFDDKVPFSFEGETDQAVIEGARKLLSGMIQKLTKFDDHLSQRQPSPLPAGLWTIRDADGEHIASALYPLASIPKGCQQAFEPASPA